MAPNHLVTSWRGFNSSSLTSFGRKESLLPVGPRKLISCCPTPLVPKENRSGLMQKALAVPSTQTDRGSALSPPDPPPGPQGSSKLSGPGTQHPRPGPSHCHGQPMLAEWAPPNSKSKPAPWESSSICHLLQAKEPVSGLCHR